MSRCLTLFLALVLILGNAISSPCRSLRGAKLVEERVCTLNFGLNNGVTNTEIFKYSGRAQQGMAYVNYQGQESLFITVRSDRNDSPSKGQACSITQFNFVNGKLDPNPVVFTKVLPIGHGQGFGAMIRNGELYFICQSAYTSDKSTIYRSVSVVHWRGAKTSAKDVVEIPILPSTGHLARYNFITPNISSDGKYLVALCNDRKTKGSACLIFDLASLAPYPKPLHIFPISSKHAKGRGWQGLCADERYIYFVYGPIHSLAPHIVTIYNYQGEQINDFLIQDEKAAYGYEQGIINSPEGVPWNIELEGIIVRRGELFITGVCTVGFVGDVVEWKGKRYMCFVTTDGTVLPDSQKNWILTNKPATAGKFEKGKIYLSGRDRLKIKQFFVNKYKYIYKLKFI